MLTFDFWILSGEKETFLVTTVQSIVQQCSQLQRTPCIANDLSHTCGSAPRE